VIPTRIGSDCVQVIGVVTDILSGNKFEFQYDLNLSKSDVLLFVPWISSLGSGAEAAGRIPPLGGYTPPEAKKSTKRP
jgi:hypothetical protein